MKKIILFNSFMILILVASVIAAGSSTSEKTESNFKTDEIKDKLEVKKAIREKCEESENRKERIKCRLNYVRENKEDFEAPYSKIPEACRNLDFENRGKCVSFIKNRKHVTRKRVWKKINVLRD